jgi:hypothetical protein
MSNVVKFKDYLPPRPRQQRRKRQKSQYELYPLPFFNRKTRCTWDVKPTGDYVADCETGRAFALQFLKTCDGTHGWTNLLAHIASDMISAGLEGPAFADGSQSPGGIVIGFMSAIGDALALFWHEHHPPAPAS